ncbi:MAG: DNA-directed RNA polymerase subunit omega [Oscillospiraceae bacterium]|jgi:DNA-directed RNA polymerase subunit omega|nr:DNA-directed RNA polymerase subunit omega [Oscillospiraceae bacterium]
MLNVDMRHVLGKHTSRYTLVTAVSKRAREILEGAEAEKRSLIGKPVTLAINDFVEGRYAIIESEEIQDM